MSGCCVPWCMPLLSANNVWSPCELTGPAKSWVKIFWGMRVLFGMMVVLALLGAVYVVGGLGTTVPWGVLPKEQGGPSGPATLR